jgi:hypothetical protein
MLREDRRSEEETHSIIAKINRRTEVVGGKGSPQQGSPPKNNQEALMAQMLNLMNNMAARIDKLELQRTPAESPSATLAPTATPPVPTTSRERTTSMKFPHPDLFKRDRLKYPAFRFKAKSKLRYEYKDALDAAQIEYVVSRCSGRAANVLLP